jgi:hypothetical protein
MLPDTATANPRLMDANDVVGRDLVGNCKRPVIVVGACTCGCSNVKCPQIRTDTPAILAVAAVALLILEASLRITHEAVHDGMVEIAIGW